MIRHEPPTKRAVLLWTLLFAIFAALPSAADDRELLRDKTADPYVFIVLDTSGSMHWTPPCDEDDARSDIDPWDGYCTSTCPFDDPTCARVCPSNGCVDYVQDSSASTPIEVIVDNDDTGSVTRSGDWDSSSGDGYNGEYLYLSTNEEGSITFRADLPEDGDYHVYVRWVRRSHRSENVKTTIEHADGSNYLEIDQSDATYADSFNYVGTFRFTTAEQAEITLSNYTSDNGSVSADAVRFSRLPPPDGLICNATGYRCQQPLCPQGDCQAPLGGDDPTSKFFQARQALYEVLEEVPNVNFGFASFEQDQAAMLFKHYLYRVSETTPSGASQQQLNDLLDLDDQVDFDWPLPGRHEVLGTGPPYNATSGRSEDHSFWHCDSETDDPGDGGYDDDDEIGCTPRRPADVEDLWEMDRLTRIPKLGRTGEEQTNVYVRDTDGTVYRIEYEYFGYNRPGVGNPYSYGDPVFGLQVDVHECNNNSCTNRDSRISNLEIYYELISEYGEWQGSTERHPMNGGGFFNNAETIQATNTCEGIEPNHDLIYNEEPYDSAGTTSSTDDAWYDYAYKMPWRLDPRGDDDIDGTSLANRVTYLDYGDIIPLDWDHKNNENVRRRLAPNAWQLASGSDPDLSIIDLESTGETPDFRSGVYFRDDYPDFSSVGAGNRRLQLRDESERPLLARGSTPLYRSLRDFRDWYAGPSSCNPASESDPPCGWKGYAEVFDLNWACKRKYVLMLTDGDETCDSVSSACTIANSLLDSYQVNTFVIGYGLAEGSGNALECIAENGGTGDPIYPRNKDDLVEQLLDVFDQVKAESRAFASASIPAVQSTAADKIYLSSFTPIPGEPVWPGRLDVFRQPLPLDDDRRPKVDLKCSEDRQSSCHLWDVGERLLDQAPTDASNPSLEPSERFEVRIGRDDDATTDNEAEAVNVTSRRIFYGQANPGQERPGPLRLLWPPDRDHGFPNAALDRLDLAEAIVPQDALTLYYACDPDVDDCAAQEVALDLALQQSVQKVVEAREVSIEDGDGVEVACVGDPNDPSNVPCRYVLGDVFHANPQVLSSSSDFDFFRQDLCGTPPQAGRPNNCVPATEFSSAAEMRQRGYREFVRRNVWRRRTLIAATNDGQLHFIDAGKFIEIDDDNLGEVQVFTDGSGYELFSYMPRMAMPILRDQVNGDKHIYSLDGSPRIGDVFIDPVPNSQDEYEVTHREWRTVLISGLREAGDIFDSNQEVLDFETGYFALDLTTPDAMVPDLDENGDPLEFAPFVPKNPGKFLPDCLDVDDDSGRQVSASDIECRTQAGEQVPYPLELWVFQDAVEINGISYFLDTDENGFRDLGDTWSTPVIGQIAVCKEGGTACDAGNPGDSSDADVETRWVAMFGGGLDAANINNPQQGDWFYMIDIETGQAIYRRQVDGAVPSDPAALDIDNDGIIDRVYFGTTEGTLYKIDLRVAELGNVPGPVDTDIPDEKVLGWSPGAGEDDEVTVSMITSAAWEPFPIFRSQAPIYYPPTLFKIPEREQYGLAFGVGAREDLWEESGLDGSFHVIVDEDFVAGDSSLPFDEDSLVQFDWQTSGPVNGGDDINDVDVTGNLLLLDISSGFRPGWKMNFPVDFKTTNEAFVLSGILIFSVFDPLTITLDNPEPDGSDAICAQTGTTYSFVISLQNAGALADLGGCNGRCEVIDEFTTAVHTDRTVSKNPPVGDDQAGSLGDNTGSVIDEELANAIREAILGQSPRSCQFNENYEVVVSALRNSTGLNVYARVPMLVCPGDWRH